MQIKRARQSIAASIKLDVYLQEFYWKCDRKIVERDW